MSKLLLKKSKYKIRCYCCGKSFIPKYRLETSKCICHECYSDKKVYSKYLSDNRFKKKFTLSV